MTLLFIILDPKDSQLDYRNLLKHRFIMLKIMVISKTQMLSLNKSILYFISYMIVSNWQCFFDPFLYASIYSYFINYFRDHKKNEKDDEDIDWGSLKPGTVITTDFFLVFFFKNSSMYSSWKMKNPLIYCFWASNFLDELQT